MLNKIIFTSLLATMFVAPVFADTTIVNENFDSYADDAALLAAWPSSDVTRPNNATSLISEPNEFYGGMIDGKAAQFCGSANVAAGLSNCGDEGPGGGTVNISNLAFTASPSATQNVELSFDFGDDGLSSGKRLTLGLRNSNGTNLLELGMFNGPGPYAYRVQSFPSTTQNPNPNWAAFPLPTTLDSAFEVGAGFHTYKAVIGVSQMTLSLDLYADGKTNDAVDPVPGEGVDGVDATAIINLGPSAAGFNQIRFGTPSGASTPSSGGTDINGAFAAFDNISLKLVDIVVVPPTGDADFDDDGDIDGRDFLIWQRGFGTPDALNQDGDADDDDDVDGDDLVIWQTKYGETGPLLSNVVVPEPAVGMMILTALGSLLAVRRR